MRVIVPFGRKHLYTGIIDSVDTRPPQGVVNMKDILSLPDKAPIVRRKQIPFWRWMADYYLCTIGEVFNAALPAGLKIQSETRLDLEDDIDTGTMASRDEDELAVLDFLSREGSTRLDVVASRLDIPHPGQVVARLVDDRLVRVSEKLVERYRAVKRDYVSVALPRGDSAALEAAFQTLRRSPRQEDAMVALVALSEHNRPGVEPIEVPIEVLMEKAGVTRAIVKALVDKGLARIVRKEVSRFTFTGRGSGILPTLSKTQAEALDRIHRLYNEKDVVLLHGVTGSGKTEIYMHLMQHVLSEGRQVLMLVPEIALTTQLTRRLQQVFGDKVLIYHSKFSDNERVDRWKRLLESGEPCIVLGARSAVFLPFSHLGLVIVDEEHESSYKQYDPAPRYNGRDAATVLANIHGAKTLYGSATPSVETYYKATTGKFGLVSLTERYGGAQLPTIEVVDMRSERRRKGVSGYFSHRLLQESHDAFVSGKQAILFHNRRGYAPVARCSMCAFIPKCNYCDVSLTYHKGRERLVCHYCGAEYPVPKVCPECHEPAIEIMGYGTERLEDELKGNFASRRVLRMDLDTTRNKDAYSNIIDDFSAGKADMLVGTQMVTKGLDFDRVGLVGILNADTLINFPDFRASERAFNMIEQVSGRAGRRGDVRGKVIIQTYNTAHPVLGFAIEHDYLGFYEHELAERRAFGFPPFSRIINIYLKHRDAAVVAECATKYAAALQSELGPRVSPPQEPAVKRVQSLYIRKIMLKVEANASMKYVKEVLRRKYIDLASSPLMRGLQVYYDVDPV